MKRYTFALLFTFSILLSLAINTKADRLTVVASVFPLFDFAREVAGPDADVRMLLPVGVEPHSWEPKPSDIITVSNADIFLYVSKEMEPWAHSMVSAVGGKDVVFVEVMDSLGFSGSNTLHEQSMSPESTASGAKDPHFWLDLSQSARAVEMIGGLFAKEDPEHRGGYVARAKAYAKRLMDLDRAYMKGLENCRTRKLVTGGHGAFGYLAKRYHLVQKSLYGLSPDSEPTPSQMASLIKEMRRENIDVVFFEEMVNPGLAKALASETGASILVLTPAGNITADRMSRGTSLVRIMEENLENLRKGLHCE